MTYHITHTANDDHHTTPDLLDHFTYPVTLSPIHFDITKMVLDF